MRLPNVHWLQTGGVQYRATLTFVGVKGMQAKQRADAIRI